MSKELQAFKLEFTLNDGTIVYSYTRILKPLAVIGKINNSGCFVTTEGKLLLTSSVKFLDMTEEATLVNYDAFLAGNRKYQQLIET